jgi:hypothetical protein
MLLLGIHINILMTEPENKSMRFLGHGLIDGELDD